MAGRLDIITPQVTALYKTPLPTKRRALAVSGGQSATIDFQLLDTIGNPADISLYCGTPGAQCEPAVTARIREVISTQSIDIYEITCDLVDAEAGTVSFVLPLDVSNTPGVYFAEIAVHTTDVIGNTSLDSDPIAFTNRFSIWVDRGLFGNPQFPNAGPPTEDEIRLYIRDNAPEENRLLDDFEFDLAEICHSAELAVRYWNESQPPINLYFTTLTYPIRDRWLQYIAGRLFLIAANRFRRNHLPYQAAGIAIDDQNKFQQYDQIGTTMIEDYREWVRMKKVQINAGAAITSQGSSYGSFAYSLLNTGV